MLTFDFIGIVCPSLACVMVCFGLWLQGLRVRATFITRALDNGASLEEVQRAAGHADATTTKLYDGRGYNPEKSASFFASY